jgi:peroxiredoxin Q/BCP
MRDQFGLWLSLVERLPRVQEAAGSNPASPMAFAARDSIGPRPSSVAAPSSAMPVQLKVGDLAPKFRAQAVGGKYGAGQEVSLADFRDSVVVLYFYPKDDTPGCTAQACGLRDAWGELSALANIFGVSVDSAASHEKFIKKYQLPFPLLSDVAKTIVDSYGVWVEKSMYGKKYMGAERSTFVIDGAGRISAIFRKVKPEEHVTILREALSDAAH